MTDLSASEATTLSQAGMTAKLKKNNGTSDLGLGLPVKAPQMQ
jgi:hypothetical protein